VKILSQLIDAQLEQAATNPTGRESRIYFNTTTKLVHVYDGTVWQLLTPAQTGIYNAGFRLSGGEFSIRQADQTVFTANEFAVVRMESAITPGKIVTLRLLTDRFKFRDDSNATSDIAGVEFGVTSGIAWPDARPFYPYIVNSNDTDAGLEGFISPDPTKTRSPATANIAFKNSGSPTDMSTPSDIGCLMMTDANTTATHDDKPCIRIGGIRMVMAVTTDDWTVQTLDDSKKDGIRLDPYEGITFLYPLNQMGAAASTHIQANAGTEPVWASDSSAGYEYRLSLNGDCYVNKSTVNSGSPTNGTGTQAISMTVPYAFNGYASTRQWTRQVGHITAGSFVVANARIHTTDQAGPANKEMGLLGISADGTTVSSVLNNDFSVAGDELDLEFIYKAFGSGG